MAVAAILWVCEWTNGAALVCGVMCFGRVALNRPRVSSLTTLLRVSSLPTLDDPALRVCLRTVAMSSKIATQCTLEANSSHTVGLRAGLCPAFASG